MSLGIGKRVFVTDAELAEQRAKGWPDFHAEDFCHRCGGQNIVPWFAPSPLWNIVMRDDDGSERWDGIICPLCFVELTKDTGLAGHWRLDLRNANDELPLISPDGRIWDSDKDLWVSPEDLVRESTLTHRGD